eukprot:14747435-Alexandrium_andersonii.AAC.1
MRPGRQGSPRPAGCLRWHASWLHRDRPPLPEVCPLPTPHPRPASAGLAGNNRAPQPHNSLTPALAHDDDKSPLTPACRCTTRRAPPRRPPSPRPFWEEAEGPDSSSRRPPWGGPRAAQRRLRLPGGRTCAGAGREGPQRGCHVGPP